MKLESSFSERLAEVMNGMSVTELSARLGISKQSVSAYLKGNRQPKQLTVAAMAHILSVDPAWLMGYDVPKERITTEQSSKAPSDPADSRFSKEDSDLAFALWGDSSDIDDKDIEEVKRFAAFIREKKQDK